MDKVLSALLKAMSIFQVVTTVVAAAKDKGRAAIKTAVLTDLGARVASGHLPTSFADVTDGIMEDVLNAHPAVPGNREAPKAASSTAVILDAATAPAAPTTGRNFTDADLAALAVIMKGSGTNA